MAEYLNAAPMVYDQGIDDVGIRKEPIPETDIPQHCPLFFIKGQKGPIGRHVFNAKGLPLTAIYGAETFREGSQYFNHQTKALQAAVGTGTTCVVHNVTAPDAKDVANVTLYLDVLETDVPLYKKEKDGSYKYDSKGEIEVEMDTGGKAKTVKGYLVSWITDSSENKVGEYQIGNSKVRTGVQKVGLVQSKQYPIIEVAARDIGTAGNLIGAVFAAFNGKDPAFPSHILNDGKTYPYMFSLKQLEDKLSNAPKTVKNALGSENVLFALNKGAMNPRTNSVMDLVTIVKRYYIDSLDPSSGGIGDIYVYDDNVDSLAKSFYKAEKAVVDSHTDSVLQGKEETPYAINMFSFVNSNGSPYVALQLKDVPEGTRLTKNSVNYLGEGDSGTLTDEDYEKAVIAELKRYGDPMDEVMNFIDHPESVFYDTGFGLDVKMALGYFIALRHDTAVFASTTISGTSLTKEEEYSLAITLNNMFELYPESTTYGTGVTRAVIHGFSGKIPGSNYVEPMASNYSTMIKNCNLMGAGDRKWRTVFMFDKAPGSVITELKDINNRWVPHSTRNLYWAANMNFPLSYSKDYCYFPAHKTVCRHDSSTLNSMFVMLAAAYLNRIGHRAHKEFSGSIELTDRQLCEGVNEFIKAEAKDAFSSNFIVVPETVITDRDEIRGWSWTNVIHLYTPTMKTAANLTIRTHRFSDYNM